MATTVKKVSAVKPKAIKKTVSKTVPSKLTKKPRNEERVAARKLIFIQTRLDLDLSTAQMARLITLGFSKDTSPVDKLERPDDHPHSRGVSMSLALAMGFAKKLHELGFDIARTEFDEFGNMLSIPEFEDEDK